MKEYYTVKESLYNEEVGSFTAYGIGVCETNPYTRKTLKYISDVFLDQKKAEKFVDLCNRLQLDPIHLFDVVEDAILDF